jgi:uncharacterized membrane protein YkvA (DUF1232 family)
MSTSTIPFDESEFFDYIESGAARLTPRQARQLVSDLPDLGGDFAKMRESDYPETERQLWFLAAVVESVWTDGYHDMPYRAALEAAFAITYFQREVDLIPDSIEGIGLLDDAAIVQTVFARNAAAYEVFAKATKLDWAELQMER